MERILLTSVNAGSNICWIIWTVAKFHSLPFFFSLLLIIVIVGRFLFLQRRKTLFSFLNLFSSKTLGNVFWNQISHDKLELQGVLHQFGLCSSVDRTDQPNVNGANGAVFNAQLTKSTPWWIKIKAGIREEPIEVEISCSGVYDSENILIFQQTFFVPHVRSNYLHQKTEREKSEEEESLFVSEWINKINSSNLFDSNHLWVAFFWTIWTDRIFFFFCFSLLEDNLLKRVKVHTKTQ